METHKEKNITIIKNIAAILFTICLLTITVSAAPENNIPVTLIQPDGSKIYCYASGDEYFNYTHDEAGNLIIKNPESEWYEYVKTVGGEPVPNSIAVRKTLDTVRYATISDISSYAEKISKNNIAFYKESDKYSPFSSMAQSNGTSMSGTVNSIVIFIRFSDDEDFVHKVVGNNGETIGKIMDESLNSMISPSVRGYFNEITDGDIDMVNYLKNADGTIYLSYQDTNPSSYYTAESYGNNRTAREHLLLKNAIDSVKSQIPANVDYDADNDGYIDNIMFIIGTPTKGWSDLLWSHKWSLYTHYVEINGLTVYDYSFDMLESVMPGYYYESPYYSVRTGTLCHETLHVLGFPDLYIYEDGNDADPVGMYDIMASSSGHPTMYSKQRWGGSSWVDDRIKTLTSLSGTSLTMTETTNTNEQIATAFKLPKSLTGYSKDIFMEYRVTHGDYSYFYQTNAGLIVYEADDSLYDNTHPSQQDGKFVLYVFRPANSNRPQPYKSSGEIKLDNGFCLNIDNIIEQGDRVSFDYRYSISSPTMTMNIGDVSGTVNVSIDAVDSSDVYYTTDGSIPTVASTKYTAQIVIAQPTIVSAIAVKTVNGETYTSNVKTLKIVPGNIKSLTASNDATPVYSDDAGIIYNLHLSAGNASVASNQTKLTTDNSAVLIPSMVTYDNIVYVVNEIEEDAFLSNQIIKSVEISENIEKIGDYCFFQSSLLNYISIPASVTSIGKNALAMCSSLVSVVVDDKNQTYASDNFGALFNKNKTELIVYPVDNKAESYIIPDTVQDIGEYAFCYAYDLIKVILPENLINIGKYAFFNCYSLENIVFKNDVKTIDTEAFRYCYSLQFVIFSGNAPESVGSNIFSNCKEGFIIYCYPNTSGWNDTLAGVQCVSLFTADTYIYDDGCLKNVDNQITAADLISNITPSENITLTVKYPYGTSSFAASDTVTTGCRLGVNVGGAEVDCIDIHINDDVADIIRSQIAVKSGVYNSLYDHNADGILDSSDVLMLVLLALQG